MYSKLLLTSALWLATASVHADTLPPKVEQILNESSPETEFNRTPDIKPTENTPPTNDADGETLNISSEELQKQPALLKRAFFGALATGNVAGVKILLPWYRNLPDGNDEFALNLADAMLAQDKGDYDNAVESYQKVLAQQPDAPSIQMGLAQTLFADHRNSEAKQILTELHNRSDLPENFRQYAGSYLSAIKKRNDWTFNVNAYYTQDNNINSTPNQRKVGNWTLSEPESAHGIAYYGNVNKDTYLGKQWSLRFGTDVFGKYYWDNRKYDDLSARVKLGVAHQTARSETAILPYFERRWYGGKEYAAEKGLTLEWSYWFTPKNQVLLSGEHSWQKHDTRSFLDGKNSNLSATWLFLSSEKQYWTLGIDLTRKTAQDSSDAYRRKGIRLGWTQYWGNTVGSSLGIGTAQRVYDAPNFPFNYIRKDREHFASFSLWNNRWQFGGITPRLVFRWAKVSSNHPFYGDYSKKNVFIQMNKAF
ncbi:porin family protein [Kingella kingae]|uniref:porin family protein n=1 Tax=Kingella kingae TaxID=504 RepID=UPI0013DF8E8F|nr:porin family protein [Kingella kingae]MBD3614460.1 DUF560 domain-containing protein [Kingella kingae]MBD3632725.1 DUF560 domain-containing protein [Kingella kingae]MBD3660102.1 DUF560 domain-containing protein [Kingella kingae]QIF41653.1 DUF560 domain-containing protein [Kingella kingae]